MRRVLVLSVLVVIAALSIGVAAQRGRGPNIPQGPPSQQALEAAKIEKLKDNLYVITGSAAGPGGDFSKFSGGNVAVFITGPGVVLVDTKLPLWGPAILERVRSVTNKPITTIINTHTHGDHTGSNEFFGASVESIVQVNTKTNMAKMDAFKGEKAQFLPKKTFTDKLSVGTGPDRIDLYYFGRGHTNGDAWVVFPTLRVAHAGDMFAEKGPPIIDATNGGSIVEHATSVAKAAATLTQVDTIIPGHSTMKTRQDLAEYAAYAKDFIAWASSEIAAGKTPEQAAAEYKIPDKYKGYAVNGAFGIEGDVRQAYMELKK
jgi:glyoxylase-like metal-dependent hydrolase (beta-lactamase superfamily II)